MQRPFSQSILDQKMTGVLPVIPDIKIRSPGEGELLGKRCAKDYAAALQAAGARAVSVVTESTRYGGSPSLLTRVAALGMPEMCIRDSPYSHGYRRRVPGRTQSI